MPSSAPPPPPPPKQSPSSASSSSAAPKPPPAAMRDRKKLQSGGGGGGRKEQRALDSSRELSRESSSSSLVSPYHVTEVASPERVWMESLRQGGVPVPVPPPTSIPMRPTHSYTPLQRGAPENSELKFAFDMELQKRTGGAAAAPGEMDEVRLRRTETKGARSSDFRHQLFSIQFQQGYTQLSEMPGEAQGLPPPITPTSYSAQRRHQPQK